MASATITEADVVVTPPDGDPVTHKRIGFSVRGTRARLVRRRPRAVHDRTDVMSFVKAPRNGTTVVTFADGTVWSAVKSDCGCS